ncbi:hypothetical protein [Floccifex sp.]|uniref:hypothetical protein n=1 Tax=Floccifex sp. TaxID=2815810 RepID=UPI003F0E9164
MFPVLYVQKINTRLFKHCGIYPTLYFKIKKDESITDLLYEEYMDSIQEEITKSIIHQFTMAQPTTVKNDGTLFIIFRDNVDTDQIKEFCIQLIEEIDFYTKGKHYADFVILNTILMEMDRPATLFKFSKVGEKLTQTDELENLKTTIQGKQAQDHNCLMTYPEFLEEKKSQDQDSCD